MSQGKAYTKEQKVEIIESLKDYLDLGYSRNKACAFIGLDPTTLSHWVVNDEALSMKLQGFENSMIVQSRKNLKTVIDKGDVAQSNWWLERKAKAEFSTRVEQTGAEGKDLFNNEQKEASKKAVGEFLGKDIK